MRISILLLTPLLLLPLHAQEANSSETAILQKVLDRLDALERQNHELADEVHSLREELRSARSGSVPEAQTAAETAQPPLEERVAVNEQRISDQAQTKVEASQKLPLSLTGMLLFNAFSTSAAPNTSYATSGYGAGNSGATLRQTQLGLQFQGPRLPGDGRVHGFLSMDFFSGSVYAAGTNWLRIRRGALSFDWEHRSLTFGQDKPLIAPRQPNSFAEVGVPPLAGAGNLWLWLPQARYEERHNLGASSGFVAQASVLETAEGYASLPPEYSRTLEQVRPGFEGRLELWHKFDDVRRVEIAPSFHVSSTHVAGTSIASRIASFDWLIVPWSKVEITGAAFHGRNVASLGALDQGFSIGGDQQVRPIHSNGGWAQISVPLTSRVTLNLFSGLEGDRARDLLRGNVVRNLEYASNVIYRIGPNVLVAMEALQMRTRLLSGPEQVQNRYDLGLAYLF